VVATERRAKDTPSTSEEWQTPRRSGPTEAVESYGFAECEIYQPAEGTNQGLAASQV